MEEKPHEGGKNQLWILNRGPFTTLAFEAISHILGSTGLFPSFLPGHNTPDTNTSVDS